MVFDFFLCLLEAIMAAIQQERVKINGKVHRFNL